MELCRQTARPDPHPRGMRQPDVWRSQTQSSLPGGKSVDLCPLCGNSGCRSRLDADPVSPNGCVRARVVLMRYLDPCDFLVPYVRGLANTHWRSSAILLRC